MKPVLLEVDFHDNPTTAKWIIDNKPAIADAITRALVKTFKLKKKVAPAPATGIKDLAGTVKIIYTGADGVNARKAPSFEQDAVDHVVKAGEVFTVTGITTDGQFYRLKSGLFITTGDKFVAYSKATPAAPAFTEYLVKVTAYALNVRKGPGINHPIATTIRLGQVYTIVGEKDGWGQLKSGAGWINLDYTERV
ncbi:SH3 domain-containing protein [Proteiniclasticum sp. BAD-10]|uniref:SH3 domain-containing protein n=1 Tax=Proteiniclasticum sediminis TaxID=2804028 RepID=A0A941CQU3_9CLOT|nr:SH3 domain-containing protein [Proteiniclasticum sediminis]